MKKNRYLFCLLAGGLLLYIAVPRLSVFALGLEGWFAVSWLMFALFVIAGNLTALIYAPIKQQGNRGFSGPKGAKRKTRSYGS
ncbi:hypothetical protein CVD25_15220 [Bacillus canaveralius]|uniref:Uncharacterized protein n=1 Tax=Bacillus canaveralius TaxID=1403243 RepID=A0A2N5GFJ9_9BACI|nr:MULTISPECIES: hypothetical protein [Bacillus]PLR79505.1 hypothetical protein CU635_22910 [Bacillus canaveralius]PLR82331.1 hypothetical protein CVD23_16925 [Bacillus sp. V33-4]PLR95159.1 hypothetical protein CVD25_15220 [Bacillus canaveralius]RSK55861.1 hypothetical protein EJA13_03005 [Bacillus canaveralius]